MRWRLRGGAEGQHLPSLTTPESADQSPWAGIITLEDGSILQFRRNVAQMERLDQIIEMGLTPDHLLVIYASAFLATTGEEKERLETLQDQLIH